LELQAKESEKGGGVGRFRSVSIASRAAVRNLEESAEGLNNGPFTGEAGREVRGGVGTAIQRRV